MLVVLTGAQDFGAPPQDVSSAKLILDHRTVVPGQPFWAGVQITQEDGWHSYWVNPGDSGLPTNVDWTLPPGWTVSAMRSPVPDIFQEASGTTFGYKGPAVHLFRIVPGRNAKGEARISAKVNWMVCQESCLLQRAEVSGKVKVGDTPELDAQGRPAILAAVAKLPVPLKGATARRSGDRFVLSLPAQGLPADEPRFLADVGSTIDHGAKQSVVRKTGELQITIPVSAYIQKTPRVLSGVVRFGTRGYSVSAPVQG
jgi:thiol:disulfide interchange protein DsbD